MTATIYTVGHGTRSTEELVAVLRSAGVGRLFDVRRYPGSRRHPHLSEAALRRSLPALGVKYEWWGEELGGRRRRHPGGSRHGAWRDASFQGYADYTDTAPFREAIERLEAAAAVAPPLALLCAETLWWRCHRRLIADALVVRANHVVHLIDQTHHESHPLHPSLRVGDDGWPVYDVGTPETLF